MRATLCGILCGVLLLTVPPRAASSGEPTPPLPFDAYWVDPHSNVKSIASVATGDVNGDGRTDVVTGVSGSQSTLVYLQSPWHGFQDPLTFPGGPGLWLDVADLDGDDRAEIVYSVPPAGDLVVKRLSASGVMSTSTLASGSYASFDVADVTGDGRPDIVADDEGRNRTSLVRANADGSFAAPIAWAPRGFPVQLHDMNGDDRLDLVRRVDDTVTFQLQAVDGTLQDPVSATHPGVASVSGFAVGDYDADGLADIAVNTSVYSGVGYTTEIAVTYQHEEGQLGPFVASTVGPGSGVIRSADLDDDGDSDVAVLHGSRLTIFQGDPAGLLPPDPWRNHPFTQGGLQGGVVLADVNDDGDTDVVSGATYGELAVTFGARHHTAATSMLDSASTSQEQPVELVLPAEDPPGVPLTFQVRTSPQHGTLTADGNVFTYTSAPGFVGDETIVIDILNGTPRVATAEYRVDVRARATITGRAVTVQDDLVPVAGVEIDVEDAAGVVTSVTTGPDGAFAFPYLVLGDTTVELRDPTATYRPQSLTLRVREGQTYGLERRLVPTAITEPILVTSTADGGPGSLRRAIGYAASDPGANTIALGERQVYELTCAGGGDLHSDNGGLTLVGRGSTVRQTCPGERILTHTHNDGLSVQSVTLTGGSTEGHGGAISSSATMEVTDGSVLADNSAALSGGAIYSPMPIAIRASTIRDNGAGTDGGAASSPHQWVGIHDSTISDNTAEEGGGGVAARHVLAERSTIDGNVAGWRGGGIHASSASVHETTISNNTSDERGGGVSAANVLIERSTISGNTAATSGGGLQVGAGTARIEWATLHENVAPSGRSLASAGTVALTVTGTAISGPPGVDVGTHCALAEGGTSSSSYTFTSDASCGFDGPTDMSDAGDPGLGPLADNGGPTFTHRPDATGPLASVVAVADGCEGVDQRGAERPVEQLCEIGAVEQRFDNHAPVIPELAVTSYGGWPATLPLPERDIDGDLLAWSIPKPTHGTLAGEPPELVFRSDPGFVGTELLPVAVEDRQGERVTLTLTLTSVEFPDVPPSSPFHTDISWLAATQISTGYQDGTFRPTLPVSRQGMVAFLHRLAGSPQGAGVVEFSDVGPNHPFLTEIAWAVDQGIVTGYPDGSFRPGAPVSRQAAVALLHRMAGSPAWSGSALFSDVPTDHPFREEIAWATGIGLVTGFTDGTFRPGAPVTRQAMAAFLHRFSDAELSD